MLKNENLSLQCIELAPFVLKPGSSLSLRPGTGVQAVLFVSTQTLLRGVPYLRLQFMQPVFLTIEGQGYSDQPGSITASGRCSAMAWASAAWVARHQERKSTALRNRERPRLVFEAGRAGRVMAPCGGGKCAGACHNKTTPLISKSARAW